MLSHRSGPPHYDNSGRALIVFGGYFVWTGFLRFLDSRGSITYQTTQTAVASATSAAVTPPARATFLFR
jgi:hypothetical protein